MLSEWMSGATALVVAVTALLNAIQAFRTGGRQDGNRGSSADPTDG